MTARAYEECLAKGRIEAARTRFGLDDAQRVERQIMDFEARRVVSKAIKVCVRGGMATPFHTPRSSIRLSEDIDMYALETIADMRSGQALACRVEGGFGHPLPAPLGTTPTRLAGLCPCERLAVYAYLLIDSARMRMRRLEVGLAARGITAEEYRPRGGGQATLLVTYKMRHASAMGGLDKVKIDFLRDPRLERLPRREFKRPFCLGHFPLLHSVAALDAGALVADKTTSLSAGTTGCPASQKKQMNKQVYDIVQLLKHMPDDQVTQAVCQYGGPASHKGKYSLEHGNRPAHEAGDTAGGACKFLLSVLRPDDRFVLESEFSGNFGAFEGAYLGKRHYSRSAHQAGTLLALLFAAVLLEHGRDNMSTGREAGVIRGAADILKLMGNPSTRKDGKTRTAGSAPSDSHLEDRIRNLPPDSQPLLRQVSSVSPGLLERRR